MGNNPNFNYLISILKLPHNLRKKVASYWGKRGVPRYKLDIVSRSLPSLVRLTLALPGSSLSHTLYHDNYDHLRPQLSKDLQATSTSLQIIPGTCGGCIVQNKHILKKQRTPTTRYYLSNEQVTKPKLNYKS